VRPPDEVPFGSAASNFQLEPVAGPVRMTASQMAQDSKAMSAAAHAAEARALRLKADKRDGRIKKAKRK
tara:strand:- start:239 stop:445 length:207 start_codon:yes stop_codon:yes gene_type:complete